MVTGIIQPILLGLGAAAQFVSTTVPILETEIRTLYSALRAEWAYIERLITLQNRKLFDFCWVFCLNRPGGNRPMVEVMGIIPA